MAGICPSKKPRNKKFRTPSTWSINPSYAPVIFKTDVKLSTNGTRGQFYHNIFLNQRKEADRGRLARNDVMDNFLDFRQIGYI